MMGLLPDNGEVMGGSVLFEERTCCASLSGDCVVSGARTSHGVPRASVRPQSLQSIGDQLVEAIRTHTGARRNKVAHSGEGLREMGLPDPPQIMKRYRSKSAEGKAQRLMLSMALTLRPKVLVPTSRLPASTSHYRRRYWARLKG